jgi:uncharacterized protein YecT (DUF1311 family)
MRVLICALLIAIAPLPCQAEDLLDPPHPALAAIQANRDHCKDATPGNIPERLCTTESSKAVDALLNKLYGRIVAKLKEPTNNDHDAKERAELLKRLIVSERAWIVYRDAECDHSSGYMLGGSGEPTIYEECLFTMRRDRVNNLFRLYQDRFPDLAKE